MFKPASYWFKAFLCLSIAIAFVAVNFTAGSKPAYAAATNLLPATLTLNDNIKVSSQQSTRTAVHIGDATTWTLGSNSVYSANGSNLWAAVDLGSSSTIAGFTFNTSADDAKTITRGSQYELSYSNDASLWDSLSTKPSNNAITFSPTDNGWTSAAVVPTNTAAGTVTNGTYSWSVVGGLYTTSLTFTAPITARYILINYTLQPSASGQLGIGLLQIAPPITLAESSGSFYKRSQNTVSTAVYLNAASSFTGISNGSYTLVQDTDYTVDADNVVTFAAAYLNSLDNESYDLSFNFSSSQGSSSLPYALTVAAADDSSLSPQGAAYIPMSPSPVSTTLTLHDNQFINISDGTTVLPSSAYTISGDTVTFDQSYLNTLSLGVHSYMFNFDQGAPQTFMLTISGTPPAAGIDYLYWTLQEPLPGGAGQTSQTLQDGYSDPYFYIGADGSQVFMDTAAGGTTSGSAHPRSELREYDPVAGQAAAWLPAGANMMTNSVAVSTLGTLNGVGWTTIGQVFDQNVTTLCELEYGYDPDHPGSNIRILYEPSGLNKIGYQYIPVAIPLNQYFTYRMELNDGDLAVYVNGSLIFNGHAASPDQVVPPDHLYYFKAGNYDQTAAFGDVNVVPYTVVQFRSIGVYHASTVPGDAGGDESNDGSGSIPAPVDDQGAATDGKLTLAAGQTGEVSLDNQIVVSIPAGATDQQLQITIQKVTDTQTLLTDKDVLASPVYEILKNFAENFSKPVTLEFAFDPASLKGGQTAAVFYYDEARRQWVEVPGGKVNGDRISVEVDHFTKYAVFAVDRAAEKPAPAAPASFSDIAGHWAETSIGKAVSGGIVSGYPDGTFRPDRTVTRAEFTVMLMNALEPQGEGAAAPFAFSDSAQIGDWAQQKVAQAVKAGIVQGYADGSFRPDAEITRAEMAVMLAGALGLNVEAGTATGFADDSDIPAWAKGAVAAAKKQALIEGGSAGEFGPAAPATRAEAVTVLVNALAQKSK